MGWISRHQISTTSTGSWSRCSGVTAASRCWAWHAVGLSRSAVQDRLARLKRQGVIKRFTIDTTGPVEPGGARAFFFVRTDGRPCGRLIPMVAGFPEVESCDHVSGPMDMVLSVRGRDLAALSALRERMVAIPGIATVTVAPVLKNHLDSRAMLAEAS